MDSASRSRVSATDLHHADDLAVLVARLYANVGAVLHLGVGHRTSSRRASRRWRLDRRASSMSATCAGVSGALLKSKVSLLLGAT
jgi:hypothetical protein